MEVVHEWRCPGFSARAAHDIYSKPGFVLAMFLVCLIHIDSGRATVVATSICMGRLCVKTGLQQTIIMQTHILAVKRQWSFGDLKIYFTHICPQLDVSYRGQMPIYLNLVFGSRMSLTQHFDGGKKHVKIEIRLSLPSASRLFRRSFEVQERSRAVYLHLMSHHR